MAAEAAAVHKEEVKYMQCNMVIDGEKTAKKFAEINVKAAALAGAAVGFLSWLFGIGFGFAGMPMYGFMTTMMGGYNMMGYYYGYASFAVVYFIALIVIGALLGAVVSLVYNWVLKLK